MNRKGILLTLFVIATACALAATLILSQAASTTPATYKQSDTAPKTSLNTAPQISLNQASISGIELASVESGNEGVTILTFRNATGHPVTGFSFDFGADQTPDGDYYYKSRAFDSPLEGGLWIAGETTSVPVSLNGETTVRVVAIQFPDQKAIGDPRILSAAKAKRANMAAVYERILSDVRARVARAGANASARKRELDAVRQLTQNHSGMSVSQSPGGAKVIQGDEAEGYAILGGALNRLVGETGEESALEALAGKLEKAAKRNRDAAVLAAGGVR